MSVAVYNHYKRLMQQQMDDERLKKVTSLWWDKPEQEDISAKTIAKMLDVPLAIVDATVLRGRLCWGRRREYLDTSASGS
jgi:ATP-dependent Clp protease ATP-binding subunit ClpX